MQRVICIKYKECNQTKTTCRHKTEHEAFSVGCEESQCMVLSKNVKCICTRKFKLKQLLENELNKKRQPISR